MRPPRFLLQMWLAMLATVCLSPEKLDPWHGWVTFKRYVRVVEETPDPGVSVQISTAPLDRRVKLYFVRQAVVRQKVDGDATRWLEPLGGVVCEFSYPEDVPITGDWELWSFDCPSLEEFIDRVEQHPGFADLVVREPVATRVYWRKA